MCGAVDLLRGQVSSTERPSPEKIMREPIPLTERKHDILILAFWGLNILFITYQVDIEQLLIKDPSDFEYQPSPVRPRA